MLLNFCGLLWGSRSRNVFEPCPRNVLGNLFDLFVGGLVFIFKPLGLFGLALLKNFFSAGCEFFILILLLLPKIGYLEKILFDFFGVKQL